MPFIDARDLPSGKELRSDLCIVGAGPAGIAIATALRATKLSVTLLESGAYEYEPDTQALATGTSIGLSYPDLSVTRLRFLGGTSNHWGGNVKPLDPMDFKARPWVPRSGWPFGFDALKPYYAAAGRFAGLPDEAFELAPHAAAAGGAPWSFADNEVRSQVFHTVGPSHLRLGQRYRAALGDQKNLDVLLHANVTRVALVPSGRAVAHLEGRTLTGGRFRVRSRAYVLAAGGIENPRLLLASNDVVSSGVGNQRDLVGRYFMEHLTSPEFADFYPSNPQQSLRFYRGFSRAWGSSWGILSLAPESQRRNRTPNIRFQLSTVTNEFNRHADRQGFKSGVVIGSSISERTWPDNLGWHIANVIADIDEVAGAAYYRLALHPEYPLVSVQLVFIAEQIPNRESRVLLGTDRDGLGVPRAVLDWRVTDLDSEGVLRACQVLANQVGRSGLGRVAVHFSSFAAQPPKPHIHHMGTTRIGDSDQTSVVDIQCRVHGVANLFIAGSSVFPTSGNVNPTLTILALALRLADHLGEVL